MKLFKWILVIFVIIVGLNVALIAVNILQNGLGDEDGLTMETVLNKPVNDATAEDMDSLSKADLMRLFNTAQVPDFSSMKGEYKAKLLPVGVLSPATSFITHNLFGPGRWEGKAFYPFQSDKGWGYNLFSTTDDKNNTIIHRTRKMDTWIGISEIDGRNSFHLVYEAHNGGIVNSMHDEIRKVNDQLYICMGYMALGGGSINPAPFILYGDSTPWVGLDKE
jgi:hypothetical protein